MQGEGGSAEGPVSAVTLVRAGEMSHRAACLHPLLAHSLGMGLSQPLQAPGERAEQFGRQPCCLSTSCNDHSRAGTHPSLGPASSAKGFCLDSANDSIGISPLLHRCSVQPQHGHWGRGKGQGGFSSSCWRLEGGDRQGSAPLGLALVPSTPGSLHPWSPQHSAVKWGWLSVLSPFV